MYQWEWSLNLKRYYPIMSLKRYRKYSKLTNTKDNENRAFNR